MRTLSSCKVLTTPIHKGAGRSFGIFWDERLLSQRLAV